MTTEVAVRERPILFSGPMVRAILDGRKSQTRRVVTPQPGDGYTRMRVECPYGKVGDRLWVRETWGYDWYDDGQDRAYKRVMYRADDESATPRDQGESVPWNPSIHMPRCLSRITLEIKSIRVEELQDIGETDAIFEGVDPIIRPEATDAWDYTDYRGAFAKLWDLLNAKRGYGWDSNPWVWVIEFRRAKQ